jgi:uncharacterized membrane protein YozB (DUF420 family)
MNDHDSISPSAVFIERLCRWLLMVGAVLGFFALKSLIEDFLAFSAVGAPGVESAEDVQILERLNWITLIFGMALWASLAFVVWSFWKRRNWARKALVGIFALVALFALWWAILTLGAALGVSSIPGPPNASSTFKLAVHFMFGILSVAAAALAYLCWRLIGRLRSREVCHEFSTRET